MYITLAVKLPLIGSTTNVELVFRIRLTTNDNYYEKEIHL